MKRILIIGIGAGNPDYITMQAVKALNRTDVFFLMDKGQSKDTREAWRVERGEKALDHMESQLRLRNWLAVDRMTIADIALFAYTRNARKGGFEMSGRPNVFAWISVTVGPCTILIW